MIRTMLEENSRKYQLAKEGKRAAERETREAVFEAVLAELQEWKWERWTMGDAAAFTRKLEENSRKWRERYREARP